MSLDRLQHPVVRIPDGIDEGLRLGYRPPLLPAIHAPVFHDQPIRGKRRIRSHRCGSGTLEAREGDQLLCLVGEALRGKVFIGEVVPIRQLCDASLQRALDRVPGQLVRRVRHGRRQPRQRHRLVRTDIGELFQVRLVHLGPRCPRLVNQSVGVVSGHRHLTTQLICPARVGELLTPRSVDAGRVGCSSSFGCREPISVRF